MKALSPPETENTNKHTKTSARRMTQYEANKPI